MSCPTCGSLTQMTPPVSPAQPHESFLPVQDAQLCLHTFGDPGGPVLLLVAGAASSMDWWDDGFCRRLADAGRCVVRYDHRDTGASTTCPPGAPTYDGGQLSRDCLAVARHVAATSGPVHLVGLSMGGGIAQGIALEHPDLLASLTLVATSAIGGIEDDLPGPAPRVAATFEQPPPVPDWSDPEAALAHLVEGARMFSGPPGIDEDRISAIARQVLARSAEPASADNHWLVILDEDDPGAPPSDVHDITIPTLVLHGSDDPLFPLPHGEALAAAVPGARLVVLEGMGHEHPPPTLWDTVITELLGHSLPAD